MDDRQQSGQPSSRFDAAGRCRPDVRKYQVQDHQIQPVALRTADSYAAPPESRTCPAQAERGAAIHRATVHQPLKPGARARGVSSCGQCSCRDFGMCSVLTEPQLRALNSIGKRRIYTRGEHIFEEGGLATHCAIVIAGVVKLSRTEADGQTYITGLIFQQDFLGRIFQARHGCTAEAATEVELCMFPRGGFVRILNRNSKLERQLFTAALNQLDAYCDWAVLISRRSAYQRVAGVLHLMATRGAGSSRKDTPGSNTARFVLPMRREEIAGLLGVTLETVSRQMTLMKKEALISLVSPREVVVPNVGRLGAVAAAAGADGVSG
jgi:CRP/FNR family transcriptional regulator, anaerobic regulatory protein